MTRTEVKAVCFSLVITFLVVVYLWDDGTNPQEDLKTTHSQNDLKTLSSPEDLKSINSQLDVIKDGFQMDPSTNYTSYVYTGPRCEKNSSADNITDFSSLPKHIQDFLYYKDCRHFPLLLDVPGKCGGASGSADVFLLLVIKSPPVNHDLRQVLRSTWAMERSHYGATIRRVFLTGIMRTGIEKDMLNNVLQVEQRKYNDIIQWDITDTSHNATLKQLLFLEWMDRNCPKVHFLLYGEDDIFVNTYNMVEYLQGLPDNNGDKHLFVGSIIYRGPVRAPWSRYFVPVQVYEQDSYPPYCDAAGVVMSGFTASVIYNMSHTIPLHPLDDIYMGICLAKAGLGLTYHGGWKIAGLMFREDTFGPCYYSEMMLVHCFQPARLDVIWNSLHDSDLKCRV